MVERIRTLLDTRQLTPTQFADAIGIARPIVSHILSGRNKPSLEVVQRILAAMPDISMPWLLNGSGSMLATTAAPVAAVAQTLPQPAPVVQAPPAVAAPEPTNLPNASGVRAAVAAPIAAAVDNDHALTHSIPEILAPESRPEPGSIALAAAKARPALKRFAPVNAKANAEAGKLNDAVPAVEAPVFDTSPAPAVVEAADVPAEIPAPTELTPQATSFSGAAALFGSEKPIRRIVIFYRDGSFADYQPE